MLISCWFIHDYPFEISFTDLPIIYLIYPWLTLIFPNVNHVKAMPEDEF